MNLEEYYDNIYRYCYLHTQNRHTAEDLTQETFLKFLETSNYQDRGKPLAFLYTIARNLCIDHIRQNSKSSDACRRAAESFIPAAEDTELAATSVVLSQAVKELSETDREIICLRYVLEMNPGEIGRLMDLSRFSVYRRLKHALKQLENQLRKEDFMLAFITEHLVEILFGLISAGALAACRYFYK